MIEWFSYDSMITYYITKYEITLFVLLISYVSIVMFIHLLLTFVLAIISKILIQIFMSFYLKAFVLDFYFIMIVFYFSFIVTCILKELN
jgi:hypothetical protein